MAKIKQLKTFDKTEDIFPITKANAVYNNDGDSMENIMSNLENKMDILVNLLQGGALEDFVILASANYYDTNTASCSYTANGKKNVLVISGSTWGANSGTANKYTATLNISTTGLIINQINNDYLESSAMNKWVHLKIWAISLDNGQSVTCSAVSSTGSYVTNFTLILGKA